MWHIPPTKLWRPSGKGGQSQNSTCDLFDVYYLMFRLDCHNDDRNAERFCQMVHTERVLDFGNLDREEVGRGSQKDPDQDDNDSFWNRHPRSPSARFSTGRNRIQQTKTGESRFNMGCPPPPICTLPSYLKAHNHAPPFARSPADLPIRKLRQAVTLRRAKRLNQKYQKTPVQSIK